MVNMFTRYVVGFWALLLHKAASQIYVLTDSYNGDNFFSKFNFFTGDDPDHGFVEYVNPFRAKRKIPDLLKLPEPSRCYHKRSN